MTKSYKRFYIGLLIPMLVFAAYFAAAARTLSGAGEFLSVADTLARINETYGYYGSALSQRTFYFKEHLYRHAQPKAAALGSSRVLQFRGESFSAPFANIGGMGALSEVDEIARSLFGEQPPYVLVLGADFWWFNPLNEDARPLRSPEEAEVRLSDLLLPPIWLAEGKMDTRQMLTLLEGDVPHVGITAVTRRDGFDRFGAYHYNSIWSGEYESDEKDFATTRRRITEGSGIFVHGDDVSEKSLDQFASLLDLIMAQGTKVVLFLPPLAPTAIDLMEQSGKYSYVPKAHARLREIAEARGLTLHDFHDPRDIGAGDCEFVDGIHGGQIAYARILMRLALADEDLRDAVRLPELALDITRGKGRASTLQDEVDFLGLGCEKRGEEG